MTVGIRPQRTRRNFHIAWRRDQGICRYCGDPGESVNHVIPWAFRPDNSVGNLVVSCGPCNQAASDKVFPCFEAKRDWLLERRRINDRAEQLAIEAAWDAGPLAVNGPGELLVVNAVWDDQETEELRRAATRTVEAMGECGAVEAPGRQLLHLLIHHTKTEEVIRGLVQTLHEVGYSWQEIADEVGLSREQVRKRWGGVGR